MPRSYQIIGTMSGSSLDGLDMALCHFELEGQRVTKYAIRHAHTEPFPPEWSERLAQLPQGSAKSLAQAHADFGRFMAGAIRSFIERHGQPQVDAIASHGHTLFHHPEAGFTCQIGCGASIAALTGLPTISDFRSGDIALGGQGAPLAPLADRLLFADVAYRLNLGGIANLSAEGPNGTLAFDIGPANQVLNALAQEIGLPYDAEGQMAAQGRLLPELLARAGELGYFSENPPKSLDNNWVKQVFLPIFQNPQQPLHDRLHSASHFIAQATASAIARFAAPAQAGLQLVATGGGAHNRFLMAQIEEALRPLHITRRPVDSLLIDYKEALLMALMGLHRLLGWPNCLPSATGARSANIGGALYG